MLLFLFSSDDILYSSLSILVEDYSLYYGYYDFSYPYPYENIALSLIEGNHIVWKFFMDYTGTEVATDTNLLCIILHLYKFYYDPNKYSIIPP